MPEAVPIPSLLPLPMHSSQYTPKTTSFNRRVWPGFLSLNHPERAPLLKEGSGTAHVHTCISRESLPCAPLHFWLGETQKAPTDTTCPCCSSRGGNHVPSSRRELPRGTELVEERSEGERCQLVPGCREKDEQVRPEHRAACFSGKRAEPRAPLSLLYIWQDHVTDSKKNRAEPRKQRYLQEEVRGFCICQCWLLAAPLSQGL